MDQHEPIRSEDAAFTSAEIAAIEAARAEFKARGGVPMEDVQAWLDSLDTPNPLPEPQPRQR